MSIILLSIKPPYAKNILDGEKKYEFRKILPTKDVKKILIYETSPVSMVVGEVQVIGTVAGTVKEVWEITSQSAGITKDEYDRYFADKNEAYAFSLGEVIKYMKPLPLSFFNIDTPPQSFCYLE